MARQQYIKMIPDATFQNTMLTFKYRARSILDTSATAMIASLQERAHMEAQKNLRNMVYGAVLPATVTSQKYPYWTPERYMQLRRQGRVWNAIKMQPPEITGVAYSGEVKVDRADFEKYYYAWVLNQGSDSVGRSRAGHYAPRPFWTLTIQTMRKVLVGVGEEALHKYKIELVASGEGV